MGGNAVLGGVIVGGVVLAALAGRRGGSGGGARLSAPMGAGGSPVIVVAPPGGGPVALPKARRKLPWWLAAMVMVWRLAWWLVGRAIWAAGRWPSATLGVAVAGVVGVWLAVASRLVGGSVGGGFGGWLAPAMSAPLAVLAVYAATRRHRRSDTESYAARWRYLADPVTDPATGKVVEPAAVPGARLKGGVTVITDPATGLESALRMVVRTGRVRDVVATVRKAVPVIAKVYATAEDCVSVEAGVHNGEAVVTIVPAEWAAHVRQQEADAEARRASERAARLGAKFPLTAGYVADRASGACPVGVSVEDGGTVHLEVFRPGVGARHCVFGGDTRFGKSTAMESAVKVAARSGVVAPVIVDMAGGVTFDYLRGQAVGYAATVKDARALLARVDAEYERRIGQMLQFGWRGRWQFSEQDPAVPVLLDESPELKDDPECQRLMSRGARLWAKTGIGIWVATQVTTIEAVFGAGGMGIKSQLMAGNLLSVYANQGLAGFPFDTKDIPQVEGVLRMRGPLQPVPVLFKGFIDESGAPLSGLPPFRLPDAPVAAERGDDEGPADTGGPREPLPTPRADWGDADPRERIVALLATGPRTEREIHEMTGIATTTVNNHLKELARSGRLVKAGGYGSPWQLAGRAR